MNAFSAIVNLYILMTLTASAVLIHSFKHRFDDSARYFLSAEVLITIAAVFVSFVSFYPSTVNPATNGLHNFFAMSTEVMVLLSLVSLYKTISRKIAVLIICLIAICCAILEILRVDLGNLIINPIYLIIFTGISLSTVLQCFNIPNENLRENRFIKWIGVFEVGIVLFYFIRLLAVLFGVAIQFREATIASISFYSFAIACNIFRYISYIALRITWVNPESTQTNPLNEKLANAIQEKDLLLTGLITSNRVIGISALASSLAHQLSQPLTAIALQAESLKRDLTSKLDANNPSIESVNEICLHSGNLSHLVQNLRQLFASQKLKFQVISLREITEQIIEIIAPTLKSKKIFLETSFESEPKIYGDKIQLQQVIINLLNNAIEAIESSASIKTVIHITISKNNIFGAITVRDSGNGIPPEILHKLFELYQSTKLNGLGVGLWLCKTIVDRHQGKIAVIDHIKPGACIEVLIPLHTTGSISDEK